MTVSVPSQLIDGKRIAEEIHAEVEAEVQKLLAAGRPPHLVVVEASGDPASEVYVERQRKRFVKLGIRYAICTDERGLYLGVIEKNRYLHYLRWLEKRAHGRPASPIDGSSAHHDGACSRRRRSAERGARADTAEREQGGRRPRCSPGFDQWL